LKNKKSSIDDLEILAQEKFSLVKKVKK